MRIPRDSIWEELKFRVQHPRLLAHAVNVLYFRSLKRIGRLPDGIDVMEQDWDNLLILDACRYDAFRDAISRREDISGTLSRVRSRAPFTNEFLRRNVHGRDLRDTVYVTSSPHVYKSDQGERKEIDHDFHEVVHVWREDHHPETAKKAVLEAIDRFPNKRLFVHLLPPHTPYFGEKGEAVFGDIDGNPWSALMKGEVKISREVLWETYEENLDIALDTVADLLTAFDGKTVVSSDHGQLLGDREFPIPVRVYGHPESYVSELIDVPWLESPSADRREIVAEPPRESATTVTEERAEESLRALGYL